MKIRILSFILLIAVVVGLLAALSLPAKQDTVSAAPVIFASPVNAGCYIAGPSDCRIHVEPFTIQLASLSKLSLFKLVAIQSGTGIQTTIYDFRPDQSNPPPSSGTTYTPSLVAQDYAATCGKSYEISLQGADTSSPSSFNLGLTSFFTCPSAVP